MSRTGFTTLLPARQDTLYHTVALEHHDAWLVPADDRYYRKAKRFGTIAALRDWTDGP